MKHLSIDCFKNSKILVSSVLLFRLKDKDMVLSLTASFHQMDNTLPVQILMGIY